MMTTEMRPFPTHKFREIQRKFSVFENKPKRELDKIWYFGFLDPGKKAPNNPEPCFVINESCSVENFEWRGAMGAVVIGSNKTDAFSLRRKHKDIEVVIKGFHCENIGLRALEVFHKAKVTIENCSFRGNWKLEKLVENGVGQGNLIKINGAEVAFKNCYFYNCINPVLVNSNSNVIFDGCHFAIAKTAISINGLPNPRKNDEIDGGKAGFSTVEVKNCTFFNCKRVALVEEGGRLVTSENYPVMVDGGAVIKPSREIFSENA